MEGIIVSFRRGRRTYTERQFIVDANAKQNKDAQALVGKEVIWKSPSGKVIKGTVRKVHGNHGKLRVLFERGLPGQAVLSKVEIKDLKNPLAK